MSNCNQSTLRATAEVHRFRPGHPASLTCDNMYGAKKLCTYMTFLGGTKRRGHMHNAKCRPSLIAWTNDWGLDEVGYYKGQRSPFSYVKIFALDWWCTIRDLTVSR